MKKEELIEFINQRGYTQDNYGNYIHREGNKRFKFQKISVRFEKKSSENKWTRVKSGYLKNLYIENGKIWGMK